MPTENTTHEVPASPPRDTKDSTALSPRAAKEINKLRALPRLPGLRFWATITLIFATIVSANFDPSVHAIGGIIALIGLANAVWALSLGALSTLCVFVVDDKIIRGPRASSRSLWVMYGFGRAKGTSWKPDIRLEGKQELATLSASIDQSRRHLQARAWALIVIVALSGGFIVFALAHGHGLSLFRPLSIVLALALLLGATAVRLFFELRHFGPTKGDIESAVALNEECHVEREDELKKLHRRGD